MAEQSQITGAIGGGLQGAAAGSAFGPIGIGVGAALGIASGFLSGGGENQAMNLARQQADLYALETKENRRRIDYEREMATGFARGSIGASNLQNLYSPASYTDALESSYVSDMAYESLAGSLRERMAMNQGQAAADNIRAMGIQSMLKGGMAAISAFAPRPGTPETRPGLPDVSGWEAADRGY